MIEDYKFEDIDLGEAEAFGDEEVIIDLQRDTPAISITKRDVEALAKHYKLLPADPTFKEKEIT